METKYLTAADTARLIRAQLKKHFPGQRFWVTSKTYSGGASIDINWIDGPTEKEIKGITSAFNGAEFDGMVDLKSYNTAWLLPDGSAVFAEYAQDSQTTRKYTKPHPEAIPVHMGADFIFTERHYTPAFVTRAWAPIADQYKLPLPSIISRPLWRNGKPTTDMVADYDPYSHGWEQWYIQKLGQALAETSAHVAPVVQPAPVETEEITISWDRDWTWIRFPEKPSDAVRALLQEQFKARFSSKRQAWYVMEQIDPGVIRFQLASTGGNE